MTGPSRRYVWQFTIGLGFLSGLWTAIGNDPKGAILNLLGTVTGEVYPDPMLRKLFIFPPPSFSSSRSGVRINGGNPSGSRPYS